MSPRPSTATRSVSDRRTRRSAVAISRLPVPGPRLKMRKPAPSAVAGTVTRSESVAVEPGEAAFARTRNS